MAKKLFVYKPKEINKDLALRIALHCVRNTIIEHYHSRGKITDAEMMAFNIEVVNKIYSFLELINNPKLLRENEIAFTQTEGGFPSMMYKPTDWNEPEFDQSFKRAIEDSEWILEDRPSKKRL